MLCLPGFGTHTHTNTQYLPHFRAFPASTWEHSSPKFRFFKANAELPNRPGFALPPVRPFKEGKGSSRIGGRTILKLLWRRTMLSFAGFGDLRPYEIQNLSSPDSCSVDFGREAPKF